MMWQCTMKSPLFDILNTCPEKGLCVTWNMELVMLKIVTCYDAVPFLLPVVAEHDICEADHHETHHHHHHAQPHVLADPAVQERHG